jgi:hypothetical protein
MCSDGGMHQSTVLGQHSSHGKIKYIFSTISDIATNLSSIVHKATLINEASAGVIQHKILVGDLAFLQRRMLSCAC